jgi:hypothetical protein
MRRILSERNLVVVLFIMAFVVFIFAQNDTKKVEKKYMGHETVVSSPLPSLQTAVVKQAEAKKESGTPQGIQ